MPVVLEGGCLVSGLKEGEPSVDGALKTWTHAGPEHGTRAISLRVLELDGTASLHNEAHDEVLYVIEGSGAAIIDGEGHALTPDHGIYLPPGQTLTLNGTLTLVSTRCPATPRPRDLETPQPRNPATIQIVPMSSRPKQQTADRWYREIINDEAGSVEVTQFVGSIPPGRAPDHYHLYEEVLCILDGHGAMWAGMTSTPITRGSCIFLPHGQVHCVENRGDGELRLLGVFYPAGSPAVRYSPP
jgi:mannose-6-phosphate isomerase-like protein (cupin superfamily)